ncbi:uncharacterized protein [Antedon mediterranea]|uniref:uncharacterized protein isoform X2 n=1 Tax=Antedon mediterranea TaxID=105859 RepID=UPI003AF88749
MANEESNIIILGAEVETSQYVPKDSTLDNEKSSQETGHSDPHTNSLIDFDLMAESNFSLKNHMREQICKDDLVQQYCESLSEVLSTEDIKNQHLNMEQGMKLSSTAESGLGSSDGDALSDRASCDGMDRSSCDGMERASVDDGQNTKNDSNNCKNINLLEMEISLTNTETSGYETPLSPLSPTSVDLSVGQNDAFNRPNIAKQNSQEKVEQRRIENNEKRKSFFGSDSSFDDVMTFEPKLSNTPVTLPSSISPSVSILPKLNDSFPRQQQHSTFTSDYIQRERSSTDSELYNENKTSKIEPRNRSLTESEMEELKKAQALAAEKKSSKFMKQLYYGINSPDAENCEVDENGKPLYEYEYERRHLIGSMKMKKQKRESWINEGNDSNLSDETGTEIKKMVSVKIDKHKEELVPDNQEVTSKLDNNKCNNKRINNIKSGKEPIEKNNSEKQGDQLKPISVQERLELLNLNKESTNGLVNKGKFSRTPVKKKSSQISIENGEKSEVEVVEKEKTNDNKTTQIIEQDSKGQDIENTTICMKAARSMFESKISKTNSEGLKRRQTTPSGEVKNLSVFQSRLSLRKNEAQNEEQKMREKILADINSDDMNVKIIERNHPDLLTDFEDLVDSGGTYMSYDVTETSEAEKIKSETIVEREIRLQREREEEFVRTGSSKLQKPSPQEKEKRQSVAEEQEKEQENIKAHETVVEREIREQKEREAIITRERKRVMGEKQDISRDCLPSSTDRAKPIVDDSSRIMIYGLGMSTNGTPEVRVQRFSGTEEQWSRFKTAPYSSYKEYQKLLRGQSKQGDDATDQPNKAIEESKQESTPTRKAGFLMSSPKSSLAYIHKATNDDSFSLDTVPDVIIRDKQTTEPKRRTLTKKESTIERDIRLTQEREEELAIQKRKTKDLVKHNLTVTDSLEKCPVGKTFSTSCTCSNSSSISSTSSVRGRLASKQKDERKKEDEQKRVIIKSVSKSDVTDEQNESVLKDKKKVQVKESIIQREIRLQKEREDSIKKEHDRLKPRPKSSYQLEVKPQEGDTEASKRRSAPVTDNLTQLQAKKESGHSIKRKSKLALQWEQRLQKQ